MSLIRHLSTAAALLLATSLPHASLAQEEDRFLILGFGAAYEPVFSGSDTSEVSPELYINARSGRFFFNDRGAGIDVFSFGPDQDFTVGVALGYAGGRQESDDSALAGLGDIDASVEASVFFAGEVGPLEFGVDIVQDVGSGSNGLYVDIGAGVERQLSDRFSVELGITSRWANNTYSERQYGITAAQAATSAYAPFDAGSGFVSTSLELEGTYALSSNTFMQFGLEGGVLMGGAKDSPLSKNNTFTSVSIGIARRF